MDRDPRQYSRLLVLGGLLPLLLLDLAVGLPSPVFVGGSGLVLLAAAGVHAVGDQPRAAAGWLVFAVSLCLFAVFDVPADPLSLVGFLALLAAGFLLLASERVTGAGDGDDRDDADEDGDGDGGDDADSDGYEDGDGYEDADEDPNQDADEDSNQDADEDPKQGEDRDEA